jgi:hypothetical protein
MYVPDDARPVRKAVVLETGAVLPLSPARSVDELSATCRSSSGTRLSKHRVRVCSKYPGIICFGTTHSRHTWTPAN